MRPDRLIAITATGTEVGKTWVAARLAESAVRTGLRVAARKPVQSFEPDDGDTTDAEILARATGEQPDIVCPKQRWYPKAVAPPMAAAVLGLPRFTIDDLVKEITWPPETQLGIVEGVGGIHSPLADDGDTLDLLDTLRPDLVVVVADARLGAINMIRLTAGVLRHHPFVVHINRYDSGDELDGLTLRWLTERCQMIVTTTIEELARLAISADEAGDTFSER